VLRSGLKGLREKLRSSPQSLGIETRECGRNVDRDKDYFKTRRNMVHGALSKKKDDVVFIKR